MRRLAARSIACGGSVARRSFRRLTRPADGRACPLAIARAQARGLRLTGHRLWLPSRMRSGHSRALIVFRSCVAFRIGCHVTYACDDRRTQRWINARIDPSQYTRSWEDMLAPQRVGSPAARFSDWIGALSWQRARLDPTGALQRSFGPPMCRLRGVLHADARWLRARYPDALSTYRLGLLVCATLAHTYTWAVEDRQSRRRAARDVETVWRAGSAWNGVLMVLRDGVGSAPNGPISWKKSRREVALYTYLLLRRPLGELRETHQWLCQVPVRPPARPEEPTVRQAHAFALDHLSDIIKVVARRQGALPR